VAVPTLLRAINRTAERNAAAHAKLGALYMDEESGARKATRWLGLDGTVGRCLFLDTAALSVLGYRRSVNEPVIRLRSDCEHLARDRYPPTAATAADRGFLACSAVLEGPDFRCAPRRQGSVT